MFISELSGVNPKPSVFACCAQMMSEQMVREYFHFSLSMWAQAVQLHRPRSQPGPVAIPALHMLDNSTSSFLTSNVGCVSTL